MMSLPVLERFTEQYIGAHPGPEVIFSWQGGEPTLMGLDFFKQAIAFQKKYARPGLKISNTFQTNGILLDDHWAKFLHEHQFLVGLSMDGPPELHNKYRKDPKGQPTLEKVRKTVDILNRHKVDYNILACVHAGNVEEPLKVYRYFKNRVKAQHIQFIPIVVRDHPMAFQQGTKLRDYSVSPEKFGDFLIDIFNDWIHHDVGRVFVQTFEVWLAAWMGRPGGVCAFAPYCGASIVMEHNGDIYACDHYVEPQYKLGNVMERPLQELVDSQIYTDFMHTKSDSLPDYCKKCMILFCCYGGCPKDRVGVTPTGEQGLNHLCLSYKRFFAFATPFFQRLAELIREGYPAEEIMEELKD
jgi:uncharacterized protein